MAERDHVLATAHAVEAEIRAKKAGPVAQTTAEPEAVETAGGRDEITAPEREVHAVGVEAEVTQATEMVTASADHAAHLPSATHTYWPPFVSHSDWPADRPPFVSYCLQQYIQKEDLRT